MLLSDGYRTFGRSIEDAAAAASTANVPVSTIAFGTDEGTVDIDGSVQRVPVDRPALEQLAESTQGYFYEAASAEALQQVYQDMGSSIGYRTEGQGDRPWFVGIGLLFALAAARDESAVDLPAAVDVWCSRSVAPRLSWSIAAGEHEDDGDPDRDEGEAQWGGVTAHRLLPT